MKNMQTLKFVISLGIASFATAIGLIWAKQGLLYHSFAASIMLWSGYLWAHKSATGKFIDGAEALHEDEGYDNKVLPRRRNEFIGVSSGALVLVSGIVIGAPGIKHENLFLTSFAAILFMSGYIIAHYSATKELL